MSVNTLITSIAIYFVIASFFAWRDERRKVIALEAASGSGKRITPRTVTSATRIVGTDTVIRFDAAAGEIIQSLPPVTDLNDGQRLNFHKIDKTNNKISFILDGSDSFAGFPEITLNVPGASVTLEANVSYRQWFVNP